jgi:hypothetical protein
MGSDKRTWWDVEQDELVAGLLLAGLGAGSASRRREVSHELNKLGLLRRGERRAILTLWMNRHRSLVNQLHEDPEFRNDWSIQATHIELGGPITKDMRKFIVRVLRGEEKRPPHRVKTIRVAERQLNMVTLVATLEYSGYSSAKAIQIVAGLYDVDDADVKHALKKRAPTPLRKKVNEEFRKEIRERFGFRLPRKMQQEFWGKGGPAPPTPWQGD